MDSLEQVEEYYRNYRLVIQNSLDVLVGEQEQLEVEVFALGPDQRKAASESILIDNFT